jgi:hypothetical protein
MLCGGDKQPEEEALRKLLLLVGLSMLGTMMLASVAFAQSGVNLQEDAGDNIDPQTGEVVGDDTPDCASSAPRTY